MERWGSFRKRSRVNTDIGMFFSSVEEVRQLIQELKSLVNDVKDLETDISAVPISNDTRHQELNELYGKVTSSSTVIRIKLKAIGKEITESEEKIHLKETTIDVENAENSQEPSKYIPVSLRIRKTQHSALLKQFSDVMTDYQTAQVEYRDQAKARLKRQLEITNSSYSESDLEDMLERGNVSVFTKSIQVNTELARKNLEDIQARHHALVKLEQSIQELSVLFQQLAEFVELQGATVDNIEQNVTKTKEYVKGAVAELATALPIQKSIRKKKVYLITAGILILVIIAVVLIIHFRPFS